jgi:phage/plasmid primase-like uncharacterized protein
LSSTLPSDLVDRARTIGLGIVLHDRGIKLAGRGQNLAGPCPRCGGKDRFAVHLGKGVFHCRGCGGKGGDAIAFVQFLDACGFREAVEILTGSRTPIENPTKPPTLPAPASDDDGRRTERALEIWRAAEPIGALAKKYLERRGTDLDMLPSDMAHALRWHPQCPWETGTLACLVALWTDAHNNEARAIHRRPITADGEAASKWRGLGPTTGCVIRLWPDATVMRAVVVGEGIETTLAAATRIIHRGTLLQPAWAAGDAGHMAAFPPLAGIDALTLLVDHDANGVGQLAAAECARCWTMAGREVIRLTPRAEGTDFSNVVCS